MHILADENIAQASTWFSGYGRLTLMPGRKISAASLEDVDVLLVRSVTHVNRQLLSGSPCRFVGTATSGIDHVDQDYLAAQGIGLGWALGCNAQAVVDYVFSAMAALFTSRQYDWLHASVGIIGCGEIGSRLATRLLELGLTPVIHDPFLQADHRLAAFLAPLDAVLACSIVTLHTPITDSGPWPTRHMIDTDQLARLPAKGILINASRGAVVSNKALAASLAVYPERLIVLDAWESEPHINTDLLAGTALGTPHIAGYSLEGKLNGTRMIHAEFCRQLGVDPALVPAEPGEVQPVLAIQESGNLTADLSALILRAYNVENDDRDMRSTLQQATDLAGSFDQLRKQYQVRREFSHYTVDTQGLSPALRRAIRAVGFS